MSAFTSAYLNTRLTLYASRLFKTEQLFQLIELDIEQIIARINKVTGHHYSTEENTKNSIIYKLAENMLDDFQVLLRPFSGNERRFFNYAIRWFELINLKVLIRGKFTSTPVNQIKKKIVELGSFIDLPINKLLETEDPHEMLRLLETTAYAGIVRQARHVYDEQGNDLFLLDATIDRSFFIDLHQRTRFLQMEDTKRVNYVLGTLLDRFNLLWLLRYRFFYKLSPAKSFYLLTAIGNKLPANELMRLAKIDSMEQLVSELPEPFFHLLENRKVIANMEMALEYFTLTMAAKELAGGGTLLSRTFSYILLREAELRFLQALIKGKRLGFSADLIEQALGEKA
jgi:V/A-type H+-transporting ATPase subunit C